MPWTLDPTHRVDLPIEIDELLDGSGNYTGDWLETSGVETVRVAAAMNSSGTVVIEEGIFTVNQSDPKVIHTNVIGTGVSEVYGSASPATRYIRLKVTGGPASTLLRASVRSV